jgi:hypothetical protein
MDQFSCCRNSFASEQMSPSGREHERANERIDGRSRDSLAGASGSYRVGADLPVRGHSRRELELERIIAIAAGALVGTRDREIGRLGRPVT